MKRKFTTALMGLGLLSILISQHGLTQAPQFVYYPHVVPPPEVDAVIREGEYEPAVGRAKLREIVARTTDRPLLANCLIQLYSFDVGIGDKVDQRAVLNRLINEFPNSNWEFAARNKLIDLDYAFEDVPGRLKAIDQLVQRFGGPSIARLAVRETGAIRQLRSLDPNLLESLSGSYSSLWEHYAYLKDLKMALVFVQLNREMGWGSGDPLSVVRNFTGKSWYEQVTLNPAVKVLQPRKSRSANQPQIVVEISDGDYREPQLDWDKLEFSLDGRDLKPVMTSKSKFDTQMRENRIFEQLRLTYRPETPLTPGYHTLIVYAPVVGYQGSGLGATRLDYKFYVTRSEERDREERDDERPEDDDGDFN